MLIRCCEVGGRTVDVRILHGRIERVSGELAPHANEHVLEAGGGALLPGLHDHHLHLFGLAAAMRSVPCGPPQVTSAVQLARALARAEPRDGWIRGVGYHEEVAGELDRLVLDGLRADVPIRIQHRSGALWMLNSAALSEIRAAGRAPDGRLFRADRWLREELASGDPPDLRPAADQLVSFGITGITDAGADNDAETLDLLESAHCSGALPQKVHVMGGEGLHRGERKILLDESCLPAYSELVAWIRNAHAANRGVAVHAVTATELVLALTALAEARPLMGDRIEHAAVAPPDAIQLAAQLGVTVVLQPGFIFQRGDTYLRDVDRRDRPWLLRGRAWLDAGVPIAGGSDAPYGPPNPWRAMASAVNRRTREGAHLGPEECLTPEEALALFLGSLEEPGGDPRRVEVGAAADLCLLSRPWKEARLALGGEAVVATFCAGRLHARRGGRTWVE